MLVAVTYVYFLIFAQFAFLARLAALGVPAAALQPVMATMAIGGIVFSFVTAHLVERFSASVLLRTGFSLSGAAALWSLSSFASHNAVFIALVIGAGLGIITVSLVTHLPQWCDAQQPLLTIGIGTGLGYLLCNVPALFTALPQAQASVAAILCLAGIAAASPARTQPTADAIATAQAPFPLVLASFAALVWLDSAAFYIIQHTASLKASSWSGQAHLWLIGAIHFSAAIAAALLLRTRQTAVVLCGAVAALGAACLLLAHPVSIPAASLLYPAGVSLYSVALVAYPSFLSGSTTLRQRARRAAWLYAVAGWIGSAMGIGMGQHLGNVPPVFVFVAVVVVSAPALLALLRTRSCEIALLAFALLVAFALQRLIPTATAQASSSAVERGRQVYISEGCISCHSQYVRPGTPDEIMWGPVKPLTLIHAERPPLIGNRRQGPDLAEVGVRRSPFWLRVHLIDPAAISYRSAMPSYAFLFNDERGNDLVAYLSSLQIPSLELSLPQASWHLDKTTWVAASPAEGAHLYLQLCTTCHEPNGAARVRWPSSFAKIPPDLRPLAMSAQLESEDRLARITRFGIPGTSMSGHEYLSDHQIASIVLWLTHPIGQSSPADTQPSGDIQ